VGGALLALGLFAAAGAALAQTAPPAAAAPNDYTKPEAWLCRPGAKDVCATADLSTSVVAADGTTTVERFVAARDPKIDCFYVYPTVSFQPTANSDMTVTRAETEVATLQLARFGAQCRIFAPMYRQVTLASLRTAMTGQPNPGDGELAYHDVVDAWRSYLAHDNGGRGVVLIGHSQGSRMLSRLLREEIDGKPVQKLLVSALLPGFNITVPVGKDVGGELQSIPLCRSKTQTGCLVAYSSFRADSPPPADARFGRTPIAERQVACVNPASLGGGEASPRVYLAAQGRMGSSSPAPDWNGSGKPLGTPFVSLPGLIQTRCVAEGGAAYLAVSLKAEPDGKRTKTINGDIMIGPAPLKSWGLHLIDMGLGQGDLIDLVAEQAKVWPSKVSTAKSGH
jgi:hypothetical protein